MSVSDISPAAVTTNIPASPAAPAGSNFNPLEHPIVFALPRRLTRFSAWHEHIPFAMYLVSQLNPHLLVELGTSAGDSYCAFCQAVQELHLDTRCYAFDTWQGDAHGGFYGPEVLSELRAFHDPLYGNFSQLIQAAFSAGLDYFSDGSIDLLHLDGYHTYRAARADLLPWLVKLSPRGVVLLHDINVREREFGVWRLWDELTPHYPHFAFYHGHGLGVLAVGPLAAHDLDGLMRASPPQAHLIRTFFSRLGQSVARSIESETQVSAQEQHVQQLTRELMELQVRLGQRDVDKAELEERVRRLTAELDELGPRLESEQQAYKNRLAGLQQMLDEQTQHLDALLIRIERMTTRETELRTLFLEAQAQLLERDIELDRLTTATSPLSQQNAALEFSNGEIANLQRIVAARDEAIAWLRSELDLAQKQLLTMQRSRVWRMRTWVWRVRALFGNKP